MRSLSKTAVIKLVVLFAICLPIAGHAQTQIETDAGVVMNCMNEQVRRLERSAFRFDELAGEADAARENIENNILANRWGIQNLYGSVKSTFRDSDSPQNPESASTYAGRISNYKLRAAALRAIGDRLLSIASDALLAQDQMKNYLIMLSEYIENTSGILNDMSFNVRSAQQKLAPNTPLVREMAQYRLRVTVPDCASLLFQFRNKYNYLNK